MTAPAVVKPGTDLDVWSKLAAPLPSSAISWRQDGKATARDGKYFARFVCYVEAGTVRERLDSVVPGEWDLTLEPLSQVVAAGGEIEPDSAVAFKARLQILGVIREDVGTGKDYKQASTDAFKRAGVRFGIGHELYAFEQNWVEVDGDGKYAKPVEDPQAAYTRRYGSGAKQGATNKAPERDGAAAAAQPTGSGTGAPASPPASTLTDTESVSCPKCGGRMWDNRLTKRNPKAPDYKCQTRSCDGVIWPPKENDSRRPVASGRGNGEDPNSFPGALVDADDDLPF